MVEHCFKFSSNNFHNFSTKIFRNFSTVSINSTRYKKIGNFFFFFQIISIVLLEILLNFLQKMTVINIVLQKIVLNSTTENFVVF